MNEDRGVLGNLPRSRPGQRSEKRAAAAKGSGTAKPRAAAKGRSQAKPRAAAKGRGQATRRDAATPRAAAQERPSAGETSSGRSALGAVASVAETAVRLPLGITRELLRRIPRP